MAGRVEEVEAGQDESFNEKIRGASGIIHGASEKIMWPLYKSMLVLLVRAIGVVSLFQASLRA